MKTKFKINLGNTVGAVLNTIPELEGKIDVKDLNNINIDVDFEYNLTEARGMVNLVADTIRNAPRLFHDTYLDALSYGMHIDDVIAEINDENPEHGCNCCEEKHEKPKEVKAKAEKKTKGDKPAIHFGGAFMSTPEGYVPVDIEHLPKELQNILGAIKKSIKED